MKYEENRESLTRKRENPSESSKETEEVISRDSCQLLKINNIFDVLKTEDYKIPLAREKVESFKG